MGEIYRGSPMENGYTIPIVGIVGLENPRVYSSNDALQGQTVRMARYIFQFRPPTYENCHQ
jgi:hypothetical protein